MSCATVRVNPMRAAAKTLSFAIGLSICLVSSVHGQDLAFSKSMNGGSPVDLRAANIGASVVLYMAGSFDSSFDLDPGSRVMQRTSNGKKDIYIAKMSPIGEFGTGCFGYSIGGPDDDYAHALSFAGPGGRDGLYLTGTFKGTVNFDPKGTGEQTCTGEQAIFIAKYDAYGRFKQVTSYSCTGSVPLTDIMEAPGSGAVYLAGGYEGELGFSKTTLKSSGAADIFVCKQSKAGDVEWAHSLGGKHSDRATALVVDGPGNVYVTGEFRKRVDFDPGKARTQLMATGDGAFVVKFDKDGNFIWGGSIGGGIKSAVNPVDIALDPVGSIVVVGRFEGGNVDFDPGKAKAKIPSQSEDDLFISKWDSNGNMIWTRTIGGSGQVGLSPKKVSLDSGGNIFATGSFSGTVDFDPGSAKSTLTSEGESDAYIVKLDSDGNYVWAHRFGGKGIDAGVGLSWHKSNYLFTSGAFENRVEFGEGRGKKELGSDGSHSQYLLKLEVETPPSPPKPPSTAAIHITYHAEGLKEPNPTNKRNLPSRIRESLNVWKEVEIEIDGEDLNGDGMLGFYAASSGKKNEITKFKFRIHSGTADSSGKRFYWTKHTYTEAMPEFTEGSWVFKIPTTPTISLSELIAECDFKARSGRHDNGYLFSRPEEKDKEKIYTFSRIKCAPPMVSDHADFYGDPVLTVERTIK